MLNLGEGAGLYAPDEKLQVWLGSGLGLGLGLGLRLGLGFEPLWLG